MNDFLRHKLYYKLNTEIAGLDNKELEQLLVKNHIGSGWGSNHIVKAFDSKFFVKKIPLTELEYINLFSTKNIFKLPLFYNYGVGSAGFGAFRELNLHIKTTNWVLSGENRHFPLMYHYRIVKAKIPKHKIDEKRHKHYIYYWNCSKSIDRYIRQRWQAPYEIILCLEYIPHVFAKWMTKNSAMIKELSDQMFNTFDFLRQKGVIHFDAHFANILSDGKAAYLTDFGLALDQEFCHSAKEKKFFKDNAFYDHAEYISSVGYLLEYVYLELTDAKKTKLEKDFGIAKSMNDWERMDLLIENIESINKQIFKLDKKLLQFIKKHHDTILIMKKFYRDMRRSHKKNIKFNLKKVRKNLIHKGIVK